jgi:putative membrane protein
VSFLCKAVLFVLFGALLPVSVAAHTGVVPMPRNLWGDWSFEPGIVIPLTFTAVLYMRGARTTRGVNSREAVCFWLGWTFLTLALVSPLHTAGETLFSAHMAQHEILMLAAAPLLVLSRPLAPLLWGMPIQARRGLGRFAKRKGFQSLWHGITSPFTAWWIHLAALWAWHIPVLFMWTLRSEWAHAAQHLSFFGSALLFWWALFYAQGQSSYGMSVLYVFTTAVHTSILGALLTVSPGVWYPAYENTSQAWGFTPLQDQQLGGLIMWIPASVVYLGIGLMLFSQWLQGGESKLFESKLLRRSYAD